MTAGSFPRGSRVHVVLAVSACLSFAAPAFAADTPAKPTFSKDVAPIFQAKCQECHQPNSIAPMSLITYQDARPWARSIKERVATRQMPPWHIDRSVGVQKFKNDLSLTDEQVETIVRWVDGGSPQGDPTDLPPAKPLRELDRALPSNPAQDLSEVHRTVAQLKKRLASHGREHRGRRRSWQVDVRRTMRASLQTGGVPLDLRYRPRRPRRPELYVLCDVSTSVTSASVFFLSVLHALHDQFRKLRSFVFVERISEVTDVFERERSFAAVSRRIATDAGVADVSGYTDYGRVWLEFLGKVVDDLDPRSTVIVLGDARTNGREPHAQVFGQVAERAGRMFWINPEPRLYWNYGDSVMAAYEPFCDGVFECWTTKQLETFVNAMAEHRTSV